MNSVDDAGSDQPRFNVLLIVPAQYNVDLEPSRRCVVRENSVGDARGNSEPKENGSECGKAGADGYDYPITHEYKYIYFYASAFMKGLIESLLVNARGFSVTVLDEGFRPSRSRADHFPYLMFNGFMGTVEDIENDAEKVRFLKQFDVVGLTGQLHQISRAFELCTAVRRLGLPTIWGGIGVSSVYLGTHSRRHGWKSTDPSGDEKLHRAWAEILRACDSVVVGEAYYLTSTDDGGREYVVQKALRMLLERAKRAGARTGSRSDKFPIATVHDEFFTEGFRAENRDYLPLGLRNRDLPLPDFQGIAGEFAQPLIGIQYSLGCRFNCPFCLVTKVQGSRYRSGLRKKSPNQAMTELDRLRSDESHSPTTVLFLDDDFFGLPIEYMVQLSHRMHARRVKYSIQGDVKTLLSLRDDVRVVRRGRDHETFFLIRAREDRGHRPLVTSQSGKPITKDSILSLSHYRGITDPIECNRTRFRMLWKQNGMSFVEWLQGHGLYVVYLGVESVDQRELRELGKGTYRDVSAATEALTYLRSRRAYSVANIMVGLNAKGKGEQYARHLCDLQVPLINVFILTAYPGTPEYDRMRRAGRLTVPRESWIDDGFKFFDTMRGNTATSEFSIFEQRKVALALNQRFYADESIAYRMSAYAPRPLLDGRRFGSRLHDWIGMIYHNAFYQMLVEKGFTMPYAGGIDRNDVGRIIRKVIDLSVDSFVIGNYRLLGKFDDRVLRGFVRSRLKRFIQRIPLDRLDTFYDNLWK